MTSAHSARKPLRRGTGVVRISPSVGNTRSNPALVGTSMLTPSGNHTVALLGRSGNVAVPRTRPVPS